MKTASTASLVLLACLGACADIVVDADAHSVMEDGTGTPPLVTETPAPVVATPAQAPVQACPRRRPDENTLCEPDLVCEYGESADIRCNAKLACFSVTNSVGVWTRRDAVPCPSARACPSPSDLDALEGTPCEVANAGAVDELVCPSAAGTCACTTGRDAPSAHERRWVCVTPAAHCPTARPRAGQGCWFNDEQGCDYGGCAWAGGATMVCESGVWIVGNPSCD